LIDRRMIDGYFAVARQKGSDRDRRAALIWINQLETYFTMGVIPASIGSLMRINACGFAQR
jgi:hypothetical protein